MEIIVNEKKLDFQLEEEKTFSDVLKNLEEWTSSNGAIITGVKLNGTELGYDDISKSADLRVDEIAKVELSITGLKEFSAKKFIETGESFLRLASMREGIIYAYANGDKSGPGEEIKKFGKFLESLISAFRELCSIAGIDMKTDFGTGAIETELAGLKEFSDKINSSVSSVERTVEILKSEDAKRIDDWVKITVSVMEYLKNGIIETEESAKVNIEDIENNINRIDALVEAVPYITVKMQTGEYRDAMKKVEEFSAGFELVITDVQNIGGKTGGDLFSMTMDGTSFEENILKLKGMIENIVGALSDADYVSVCDILEYEFVPEIGRTRQFFLKLM